MPAEPSETNTQPHQQSDHLADHFSRQNSDHPHWNESAWFSLSIPELGVHGFVQYFFRPNMNQLNGGPVLWDYTGTQVWNCLHFGWSKLQACPKDAEKFNFTAPNSLRVELLEPATRYRIQYNNDGLELDLEWQAIAPIHQLRSNSAAQQAAQKYHMEQAGRMRGNLTLEGKLYAIDCYSMRDTSFGPRVYDKSSVGGYFWGISQHSAFHAIAKGSGSEQQVIGGFIWQDGKLGSLKEGTRSILEYGQYGPKRARLQATDEHGRSLQASAQIHEGLIFTGYSDRTIVWSLTQWDWSGVTHWGDNQEFCNSQRFRQIARGEIELG